MPELPEVETARRIIEKHCKGRVITAIVTKECGGGPRNGKFDNKIVAEGLKESQLIKALKGRKVLAARRRGKQLWVELSGVGPSLLLHLGMSGSISMKGSERLAYVRYKQKDDQWPPRYTKLLLDFKGGKQLAFADPRRFGKILLRKDPELQPPISKLALDPVTDTVTLKYFAEGLAASKLPVKALLLCQDKVVSGVGNWMADEMLFHAKVHPATLACVLTPVQVKAIHVALLNVCKKACGVGADYTRFPRGWLFPYRWGKGQSAAAMTGSEDAKASDAALPDGRKISFLEVGGRTTAFVPAVQGNQPAPPCSSQKRQAPVLKRPAKRQRSS
eukprot:TRINITY_DN81468_c0_g1_i1.p1 TRINITY_DN81468_c0_g1~~TRINITY_DN81468_c0_g1_i1.p1  ORF type:complete len:341 (+),score=64.62 TRINITY_DN81468_c0_g1_i1:28-1023(+)